MSLRYKLLRFFSRIYKRGTGKVPAEFSFKEKHRFPGFLVRDSEGKTVSIMPEGKKMLIVNVASECGFTPQYEELEALYRKKKNELNIVAFPCNQFNHQEPGTNAEIQNFCKTNYGITFPVFSKTEVKGEKKSELYQWLSDPAKNGWNQQEPSWNFCKYLIDENGFLIAFYASHMMPDIK